MTKTRWQVLKMMHPRATTGLDESSFRYFRPNGRSSHHSFWNKVLHRGAFLKTGFGISEDSYTSDALTRGLYGVSAKPGQ
jgi:hypothetical protein